MVVASSKEPMLPEVTPRFLGIPGEFHAAILTAAIVCTGLTIKLSRAEQRAAL